jgi:curli biogenesis system outer membrane secretion channel CsgG
MRWLMLTGLLVALTACATTATAPAPFTADQVATALQASGLPVSSVVVVTAETDPNKLLGRPGQYIGKVNWMDARAKDDAGKIELFGDQATMQKWVDYTSAIAKSSPMMLEYIHAHPRRFAVLRLPKELTPDQEKQYEDWFDKL